jgi:hypothetical protein
LAKNAIHEGYDGRTNYFKKYANGKYPGIKWISVKDFLSREKLN